MQLTLKNFKCFRDGKFDFPENTNVLITAPSGSGKSTIFEAIKFVLWGNRDVDLITFGKKKCEVILEYKNTIFKRTKNPNSFNIISKQHGKIEYPEEYILKHFPKYPLNFLSLSSSKQMAVIESMSSNNVDIDAIKAKVKLISIDIQKMLLDCKTNIEVFTKVLENLPVYDETKTHPGKRSSLTLEECQQKLKNLKITEREIYKLNSEHEYKRKRKEELEQFMRANSQCENENLTKLKNTLLEITQKQFFIKKLQADVFDHQHVNLTEIEDKVQEYRRVEAYNSSLELEIKNLWKQTSFSSKKNLLDINQINAYLETVVDENDTKTYECPECKTNLKLENNELKVAICSEVNILRIILNKLKLLKPLPKNETNLLLKIKDSIKASQEIEKLKQSFDENVDINILKNKIALVEEYKFKEQELKNLTFDVPDAQLSKIQEEISDMENNIANIKKYDDDLIKWEFNQNILKKITNYTKEKLLYEKKHEIILKYYGNIELIKRLIEEAQRKSLVMLVKLINSQTNYYCKLFFNDDITINLKEYHQVHSTKTIKSQIDIDILYKCCSMKPCNLSSGEFARIQLAFDLAIYKILNTNSPLLLDEVAANLDTDISSTIFNAIKSEFNNVFIIAHQAIEGLFDHVYTEREIINIK